MLGHLHGHASLVDRPIPASALPARSVRSVRQIAVLGHLHGHASLVDRPIPIIALPTASVAVRVCIVGYLGGTTTPWANATPGAVARDAKRSRG
jgi:hypothetical protein